MDVVDVAVVADAVVNGSGCARGDGALPAGGAFSIAALAAAVAAFGMMPTQPPGLLALLWQSQRCR